MSDSETHAVPPSIAGIRVPAYVVLARTTRQLRDIFQWNKGTVVPLEQNLDAPVEVVVDGRVIALGRMVMAAGKYAVEIVARPEARLES